MYKIIVLAMSIAPVFLCAQTEFQLKAGAVGGYEYNLFNAPQFYDNGTLNEQFQSGAFQRTSLQVGLIHEQEKQEIKFTGKGDYTYFPSIQAGNLFNGKIEGKYTFELADNWSFFTKHAYQERLRNNVVNDPEELRTPRSFGQRKHQIGFLHQLTKKNKLTTTLFANARNYAETEESSLQFREWGIELKSVQKIKPKGKKTSYLTNQFKFFRRRYIEENYQEGDEEISDELIDQWEEEFGEDWEDELGDVWIGGTNTQERVWQFLSYELAYRFRLTKYTKLKLGVTWQNRQDLLQKRFGFHEWQPFFELNYDKAKWNIKWKTAFAYRHFSHLRINENDLLTYQFLRTSLKITYEITDKWALSSQIRTIKRWSNTKNADSRSYRSYWNGLIQIGLVYTF